jgi:hypothetical protein
MRIALVVLAAVLAYAVGAEAEDCGRAIPVEVAPASPDVARDQRSARGVRLVASWRLTSPEPTVGELVHLDHAAGEGRTSDGRRLDWDLAGVQPGAFRLACGAPEGAAAGPPPRPPEVPRIRGYRYIGSRPLAGSAFRAVGLWHANEGPPESLVVVFDPTTRTMRAPYVVLVRTPLRLGAVSADAEPRALFIRIAAVTRAAPGEPVHLLEYAWRDGKAYGVPLD